MRKRHFIDKINDKTTKTMKNANCDVNVGAKGKMTNSSHVGYVTSTSYCAIKTRIIVYFGAVPCCVKSC